MDVTLTAIPGAFQLPRLNWEIVGRWIEDSVPESRRGEAWSKLVHEWLEAVDVVLGEVYRTIRSERVILFAPADFEQAVELFDFAESSLREMGELMGDMARTPQTGPLLVMLFADDDSYCRYVAPFEPAMERVRSAGVCLGPDYIHVALRPKSLDRLQKILLHELAHTCLSGLELPLWFEEGITQVAEDAAVPAWSRYLLEPKEANELKRYWREHGLSHFWWGTGFSIPDEGQLRCYHLAQILFRQILSDRRQKLPAFIRNASYRDAGDSAAREIFGCSVSEIAKVFLGEGDWEPVPPDCMTYVRRASLYLEQGRTDQALSDLELAIQLDGHSFEAHFDRATVYQSQHRFKEAIADCERAMALNVQDFEAPNSLAWLLATCSEDEIRNGRRAVELANDSCEKSGFSIWYCLGTLAAAYAEVGDFEQAQNFARESQVLAPESEIAGCEARMRSYRACKPWRDIHNVVSSVKSK